MDIRDYDEFDCEELYSIEKCDGKYELSVGSEKKFTFLIHTKMQLTI